MPAGEMHTRMRGRNEEKKSSPCVSFFLWSFCVSGLISFSRDLGSKILAECGGSTMDLLEREHCFRQLSELLRMATTGQGRTVLISGEAGIGKTALVERFMSQYCNEAGRLWCACEALFIPRPLGPLYDIATQTQG